LKPRKIKHVNPETKPAHFIFPTLNPTHIQKKKLLMTEKMAYLILHEAKGRTAITGRATHHVTLLLLSSFATNNSISKQTSRFFNNQKLQFVCYGKCLLRLLFLSSFFFFFFVRKTKIKGKSKHNLAKEKEKAYTEKERDVNVIEACFGFGPCYRRLKG